MFNKYHQSDWETHQVSDKVEVHTWVDSREPEMIQWQVDHLRPDGLREFSFVHAEQDRELAVTAAINWYTQNIESL